MILKTSAFQTYFPRSSLVVIGSFKFLISCQQDYPCVNPYGVYFSLRNFDSNATGYVDIGYYEAGSNFTKLLKHQVSGYAIRSNGAGDLVDYADLRFGEFPLREGVDLKIGLPAVGRVMDITAFH